MVKIEYVLIIAAAVLLAILISGSVQFTDYENKTGSVIMGKSHSLFYEYFHFRYPAHINVSSDRSNATIGFDVDVEKIDFGIAIAKSTINRKFLNLTNSGKNALRVEAKKTGAISEIISFGENNFLLNPGETRRLEISARPGETHEGSYSGEIEIIFKKAAFPMAEFFL